MHWVPGIPEFPGQSAPRQGRVYMGLLPRSDLKMWVHRNSLNHRWGALQGVQRMPGAWMCVQMGSSACTWSSSQCRTGHDGGRKERWSLLVLLLQAQQLQGRSVMTQTTKAVTLRMPETTGMHILPHRILKLVKGKEGEGILSTVYKWENNRSSERWPRPR